MTVQAIFRQAVIVFSALGLLMGCAESSAQPTKPEKSTTPPTEVGPEQLLASRAAAAVDLTYTADYRFTRSDGSAAGTVRVSKTADALRYDLMFPGDATTYPHTMTLVENADGVYRCITGATGSGCVLAAKKDADLPDDPRFQHAFSDWLGALSSRSAALSIEKTSKPLEGASGDCFSLERLTSSVKPPVDLGVYCFNSKGLLTGLRLSAGTLVLTASAAAPQSLTLPTSITDSLPNVAVPPPPPPAQTPSPLPPTP